MIQICSIIKNEHRYLEEWIKHHLKLGIERIILFEDGGDSHKYITDNYKDKVILVRNNKELENKDHAALQQMCYQIWFTNMEIGDMCFFIDADEYLTFGKGYGLKRLVKDIIKEKEYDLPIFWRMFNANGHIKRPKGKTVNVYTQESTYENWETHKWRHNSKTFAYKTEDSKDVKFTSIHHIKSRTEEEFENIYNRYKDKVRLNHYYTRSYEDWCEKKQRGGFKEKSIKSNDDIFFKHNPDLKDKV